MRYILILLLLVGTAYGQSSPTSAKTRFVNGLYMGTKLDAYFAAADSNAIYWRADSVVMAKYKGTARALAFASALSSYKLIADTFFTTGYTTRARTKQYGDSIAALKVNYTDTALMLTPYQRINRNIIYNETFNGSAYPIDWTASGSWSTSPLQPPTGGANVKTYWNKTSGLENSGIEATFKLNTTSCELMLFKYNTSNPVAQKGSYASFRASENKLLFYNISWDTTSTPTAIDSVTIPFALVAGRMYSLRLEKAFSTSQRFILTDLTTYDSTVLSMQDVNGMGSGDGKAGLLYLSGASAGVSVYDFQIYSLQQLRPLVAIVGDSNTEGDPIGFAKHDSTYARALYDSTGGKVWMAGIGGDYTGSLLLGFQRIFSDIIAAKPKYAFILLGTNDGDSTVGKQFYRDMVDTLKKYNVIPIFGTNAAWTVSNDVRKALNNWIRNSGEYYVELATVLNSNDNTGTLNPIYDNGDGVHYNTLGHKVIAETILATYPKFFQEDETDQRVFLANDFYKGIFPTIYNDLTVYRNYDTTKGFVYLDKPKSRYIGYDGSNYTVGGSKIVQTSSLTNNYITKTTDGITLSSSVLYESGGNLAINTTSLFGKLTINQTSGSALVIGDIATPSNGSETYFRGTSADVKLTTAGAKFGIGTTGGNPYLYIDPTNGEIYPFTTNMGKIGKATNRWDSLHSASGLFDKVSIGGDATYPFTTKVGTNKILGIRDNSGVDIVIINDAKDAAQPLRITTSALTVTSSVSATKIIGSSSTPSISGGSATYIGTGASTSVVGNDIAGIVTLITGTGCGSTGASNRAAFTVTFASEYTTAPTVIIQAIQRGGLNTTDGPSEAFFLRRDAVGTTAFTVYLPIGVTLTDSTTYEITYHVIGK